MIEIIYIWCYTCWGFSPWRSSGYDNRRRRL